MHSSTPLFRHLAWVLVLKVVVLAILWQLFIKPYQVHVDVTAIGQRLAGSSQQNEANHHRREGDHD